MAQLLTRAALIEAILEGLSYTPDAIKAMTAIGIENNRDAADAVAIADLLIERGIVSTKASKANAD